MASTFRHFPSKCNVDKPIKTYYADNVSCVVGGKMTNRVSALLEVILHEIGQLIDHNCKPDGNRFFRAFSMLLHGTEDRWEEVKAQILLYAEMLLDTRTSFAFTRVLAIITLLFAIPCLLPALQQQHRNLLHALNQSAVPDASLSFHHSPMHRFQSHHDLQSFCRMSYLLESFLMDLVSQDAAGDGSDIELADSVGRRHRIIEDQDDWDEHFEEEEPSKPSRNLAEQSILVIEPYIELPPACYDLKEPALSSDFNLSDIAAEFETHPVLESDAD
ncbi:hypothetical protein BV898_10327 [Hypsibius exemplaris]|uniref:Uncharacterized protein n=1 Tax=Hypsibius exemplaris TaxID=2072580 RepID=A0A1W0WJW3_HYPEX|nr:hypothetical protein BV898_10327 [Hypsibius exemplaris]